MPRTFHSHHHPENRSAGLVYARALIDPLAACSLPVMIGATTAALQGHATWPYLVWGFPGALLLASVWSQFTLATTIAEVRFRDGKCAVSSVHDVLRERPPEWASLYDVGEASGAVELYLGWTTHILSREDWPEFAELRSAARRATGMPSDSQPRPSMCV